MSYNIFPHQPSYLFPTFSISPWFTFAQNEFIKEEPNEQISTIIHKQIQPSSFLISKVKWTQPQQVKLYYLHDQIGNKWAQIAHQFPGKNDNCVKNHFYSKLRKSFRKLNRIIHKQLKKQYKQMNANIIYKLVEANQQRHKFNQKLFSLQFLNLCVSIIVIIVGLKNRLLNYADNDEQNQKKLNIQQSIKLINDICLFNKNYKKLPKKQRKLSEEYNKIPIKKLSYSSYQEGNLNSNAIAQQQFQRKQLQNQLQNIGLIQSNNILLPIFLQKDISKKSKHSQKQQENHMLFDDSDLPYKQQNQNPFGNVKKCSQIEHEQNE